MAWIETYWESAKRELCAAEILSGTGAVAFFDFAEDGASLAVLICFQCDFIPYFSASGIS